MAKMSQGIRSQGKNSWQIKFDLGRDPITGNRKTKFVTFKGTKRDALKERTRLLASRDAGSYVDPTKMTLAEYLQHWLTADVERRVGKRTAARYRQIVEKNITPRLGHVPLRKLTAAHIEAFEADLHREGWVKARVKKKEDDGQPKVEQPRGLSNGVARSPDPFAGSQSCCPPGGADKEPGSAGETDKAR
jgi:hypothetical protein